MSDRIMLLVVDDEPGVRMAMEDALESGGYDTDAVASGDAAIARLDDPSFAAAGLITDIQLGAGPSGWDVARAARAANPAICVVYVTGDSVGEWPAQGVPKSLVLQKPFADAQLLTAISTLLNEQTNSLPPA